jgi:hypothetical protein
MFSIEISEVNFSLNSQIDSGAPIESRKELPIQDLGIERSLLHSIAFVVVGKENFISLIKFDFVESERNLGRCGVEHALFILLVLRRPASSNK